MVSISLYVTVRMRWSYGDGVPTSRALDEKAQREIAAASEPRKKIRFMCVPLAVGLTAQPFRLYIVCADMEAQRIQLPLIAGHKAGWVVETQLSNPVFRWVGATPRTFIGLGLKTYRCCSWVIFIQHYGRDIDRYDAAITPANIFTLFTAEL